MPAQVDVDVELGRVFQDVATLPEMVTPLSDPEVGGGLIVTLVGYPVPAIPGASVVMTRPLVVTSPAGPADVDPVTPRPSTGSVDCSSVLPLLPLVSTPEGSPSSRAAPMDHCRLWSGSSSGGESVGCPLSPASLTPRPTGASPQGCQFRMTSYDEEHSGPDFSPACGFQLYDPRLLEHVGAPDSARLLTRSPEYWLHHMGREKTLAAALQLQHDAGLIL